MICAALKLVRSEPSPEEISVMGHDLIRTTGVVDRQVGTGITAKVATVADLIRAMRGRLPDTGLNFEHLDGIAAKAHAMLDRAPESTFTYMSQVLNFRDAVADFDRALNAANEWRG